MKHNGVKSAVVLGNTLTAGVLARPAVMAGGYHYNDGGRQANTGGPYEMIVNLKQAFCDTVRGYLRANFRTKLSASPTAACFARSTSCSA